jgi:uncharacterized Zn finger protein (UPF0148 family)
MKHITWRQIHTDITILKLWCYTCHIQFISTEGNISCPDCNTEVQSICDITHEQAEQMMVAIEESCHYEGEDLDEYDVEEEMEVHMLFKSRISQYDWWYGDGRQVQFFWHYLQEDARTSEGYFACALRYFKSAYSEAYNENNY